MWRSRIRTPAGRVSIPTAQNDSYSMAYFHKSSDYQNFAYQNKPQRNYLTTKLHIFSEFLNFLVNLFIAIMAPFHTLFIPPKKCRSGQVIYPSAGSLTQRYGSCSGRRMSTS